MQAVVSAPFMRNLAELQKEEAVNAKAFDA